MHAGLFVRIYVDEFSYAGPAAWNSLADHIQSITNTASLKRQLKTFLFSACSY